MGTLVQAIESKWFYQLNNGDDFVLGTGDFTNNISGNIFENVKLQSTIRIFSFLRIKGSYMTLSSLYSQDIVFSNTVNIGDICRIYFVAQPLETFIFEVTSVSDDIIYFNTITNTTTFSFPSTLGDDSLIIETPLTFLRYNHGLRVNSSSEEFYRSYLDDETTSFLVKDIGLGVVRDTTFKDGVKTAINSNPGSFKARFLQNSQIPINDVGAFNSAQDFEIEHILRVQDYSESDISNYIDGSKPENYIGENTLDYNSGFEFRTIETNPETSKLGKYISKGNIGFFDENFNGRPNPFSVSNLQIERASNNTIIDDIPSSESSIVTFTINSTENTFSSSPIIVLNHFAMVTDYEFKNESFDSLFLNEQMRISGVSSAVGTVIEEGKIINFTPNSIDVELTINPNNPSVNGQQYMLSVLVGDSSKTAVSSDKVQLRVKTGVYEDGFDIEGLIGSPELLLYQRDCEPSTDAGSSSFPIINGELIYTKFNLPVIDGEISRIRLATIDFESGNNQIVDEIDIDLSGMTIINSIQRIDKTLLTPYQIGSDGYIKWVANKDYEIVFPYRLPFDKLIAVSGLSETLFDPNEPNNGFNQSVLYQQSKGINIHISYIVSMLKDGRITDYMFRTPVINVFDFETTL